MRVETTEATIWWVALADEIRPTNPRPAVEILAALYGRFGFLKMPSEFKPGEGIEFHNGRLEIPGAPSIAIHKLVVYNDGISVEVLSTTDHGDLVLGAVLDILYEHGMRRPTTTPSHTYVSGIVVGFDASIDHLICQPLLEVSNNAFPKLEIHPIALQFGPDPMAAARKPIGLNAPGFRIERRINFPFEANRYFSGANLSTKAHLDLLAQIELVALKAAAR